MVWLRTAAVGLMLGILASACSSEKNEQAEHVGSTALAITAVCSFDTVGLPCDPDGPAGAKLECEGACTIGTAGNVSCQPVAAGTNNGIICGTTNGVGDNACKRYCSGKTCLNANAPAGAACRLTTNGNPCEGECSGSGTCEAIASPCAFGRRDQLCKVDTCNFADATECRVDNLRRTTLCSDQDACSIGSCNLNGVCVAGPTIGCDDGNACTDDACDPQDGGCVGTNNDANACSDGNACFTGEHCSAGTCVAGTVPVNCNDGNLCTTDSCDPNTGCANVPKSCTDNNACTDDSCDAADGSCDHAPKTCDDSDACTTDSCDIVTGCVFTPIDCDDADACTVDACGAGQCSHTPVVCDDSDPCTSESCSAGGGCMFTPIPGCGAGGNGSGGEPNEGGSGGASNPGGGGEPTEGGTPGTNGGVPGTDGGTPGSDGGVPGSNAGSSNAGTNSAGTSSTGANGTGASAGTAGSGTGATSSEGGNEGEAGSAARTIQSSGCGCRTAGGARTSPLGLLLLGVGVVLWRRRRAT